MPHFQVVLKHHVIMVLFDNGILAFTSCICFFAFFGFRNDPQKHLARDKNTLMSAKAKKNSSVLSRANYTKSNKELLCFKRDKKCKF